MRQIPAPDAANKAKSMALERGMMTCSMRFLAKGLTWCYREASESMPLDVDR